MVNVQKLHLLLFLLVLVVLFTYFVFMLESPFLGTVPSAPASCTELQPVLRREDNLNQSRLIHLTQRKKQTQMHLEKIYHFVQHAAEVYDSQPKTPLKDMVPLKVYVYDMPSIYNDELLLERSEVDMFFTEEFFHVMFSKSYVNTPNAANADLFYVPVYYHRFMRHLYHKGVDVKQKLEAEVSLMRAVVLKLQNSRWFRRYKGLDHVFVFPKGPWPAYKCAYLKEASQKDTCLLIHSNALKLVSEATAAEPWYGRSCIVIPGMVPLDPVYYENQTCNGEKTIPIYFRGMPRTERTHVRDFILSSEYANNTRNLITKGKVDFDQYVAEMRNSQFCLSPRGIRAWAGRLYDYILLGDGCIPVILSDHLILPFQSLLDWSSFTIRIPEARAADLDQILANYSSSQLRTMMKKICEVRHSFIYHVYATYPKDAFQLALSSLVEVLQTSLNSHEDMNPTAIHLRHHISSPQHQAAT